MTLRLALSPLALVAVLTGLAAAPAKAADDAADAGAARAADSAAEADSADAPVSVSVSASAAAAPQAQPGAPAGAPPFAFARPVFDETWATIGLGAGLVPSYMGSNDYILFPLPLIVGRVGGVGISPNGPGFVLDFNSPEPTMRQAKGPRIAFGPAFRFRNDRNAQIEDEVVARAGELDVAVEVGANVALAWRGVFKTFDTLTVGVQARWDVLGAHEGMIVEPQIQYRAALDRAFSLQTQISAEFVDDSFADYYFSVSPAQAAASGLPQFRAEGGLNRIGTLSILAYDLDRNPLNGGWSLTAIGGYSRLVGDGADTPYTVLRGDADQFIGGLGVAYTF
jgi:outer membrane scaffolding protein for murein synthesis (MipA/OmpV family)